MFGREANLFSTLSLNNTDLDTNNNNFFEYNAAKDQIQAKMDSYNKVVTEVNNNIIQTQTK
jgi:hypothetical protein